jgi:hypothetical protein
MIALDLGLHQVFVQGRYWKGCPHPGQIEHVCSSFCHVPVWGLRPDGQEIRWL